MCSAKLSAQTSTMMSPLLSWKLSPKESKARPISALRIPRSRLGRGSLCVAMVTKAGTMTMESPVIKPALDAVVYCRPIVCQAYPEKRKTPKATPLSRPSLEICVFWNQRKGNKLINARPKRIAKKGKGGRSSIAHLTMTKVEPQTKVIKSKDRSAPRLLFNFNQVTPYVLNLKRKAAARIRSGLSEF